MVLHFGRLSIHTGTGSSAWISTEKLPQAVSHGCVRLHNEDIQYLRSLVRLGTPIKIVGA